MTLPFTILNVSGPYREPREPVLSYDYSIQRPTWATAQAVRVKVSIPDELDFCKHKVLDLRGGTPGQQLLMNQKLSRRIADHKLQVATEEGLFLERMDVLVPPFTGPMQHLFGRLEGWMHTVKAALREEMITSIGLQSPSSPPRSLSE